MPSRTKRSTEPDLHGQIIQAAMRLAAEQPWTKLSLSEIARAAGVSPAELYRHFPNRHAILEAIMQDIDLAMLNGAVDLADPLKDRIFEVLMRRFDALHPYRGAIMLMAKRLQGARLDAVLMVPSAARRLATSMRWVLETAGVTASGPTDLRAKLLSLAFLSAVRIWLNDDSDDLAKTMADLDKSLKRIEPFLRTAEKASTEVALSG